ncbi:MAG: TDT family transporter [Pseudomonadales bacterium]|nr:TDT family transporter [Pseudomonadales bacterium]
MVNVKSLREIIQQFTPNWYTATMGTGILALALNQLPFNVPVLHQLAEGLWFFNIGLFVLFSVLYFARWVLFQSQARRIFSHSVMSMFFGAIPMGLATIINGFLAFGIPRWGDTAVSIAQILWWVDMAMAIFIGVLIPFLMFTRQDHSMEKMTAVWLLPVVAAEVAAVSAGLLIPHISNPHAALEMIIIAYALWAFSVPIAFSILVILIMRLMLHKLPHKDMAASGFLALGPIGTGALGLLVLGADAAHVFTAVNMPMIGDVASGAGVIGGAILWGYGMWWLLLTVLTTARYIKQGMPFNLGWWGFTFPLGVYSLATLALARQTHVDFILSIGLGLVGCLALFWSIVMVRTLQGAYRGTLFVSPCLTKGSIPEDFKSDMV